ncbi:MAG: hypothetical protein NDI94_03030 [Candidatus Woesearchaeota archaeon]|nr:hypothetical protein [Candidatus Woesearchaeota archaeon]
MPDTDVIPFLHDNATVGDPIQVKVRDGFWSRIEEEGIIQGMTGSTLDILRYNGQLIRQSIKGLLDYYLPEPNPNASPFYQDQNVTGVVYQYLGNRVAHALGWFRTDIEGKVIAQDMNTVSIASYIYLFGKPLWPHTAVLDRKYIIRNGLYQPHEVLPEGKPDVVHQDDHVLPVTWAREQNKPDIYLLDRPDIDKLSQELPRIEGSHLLPPKPTLMRLEPRYERDGVTPTGDFHWTR